MTSHFGLGDLTKTVAWDWGMMKMLFTLQILYREPQLVNNTNTGKQLQPPTLEAMLLIPMANYGVGVMVMEIGIPTMVFLKLFVNQH